MSGSTPTLTVPTPTPGTPIQATIHGFWGFDPFTGPTVSLQQTPGTNWRIVEDARTPLIAGQPNHLQLLSTGTACIRSIALEPANRQSQTGSWPHLPHPPPRKQPPST